MACTFPPKLTTKEYDCVTLLGDPNARCVTTEELCGFGEPSAERAIVVSPNE